MEFGARTGLVNAFSDLPSPIITQDWRAEHFPAPQRNGQAEFQSTGHLSEKSCLLPKSTLSANKHRFVRLPQSQPIPTDSCDALRSIDHEAVGVTTS
jgi:hypothetical protein